MPESRPSVLITGANGFVGARLCRAFASAGYQVCAGVRRTADVSALDRQAVVLRYGDITQSEDLREMVCEVDYVVHNAGIVKAKSRDVFTAVNVEGVRNVCRAVAEHNPQVKRLVLISSLAACGPSLAGRRVREDDPPHPITPYGRSKLAGEEAAMTFIGELPLVVLRPSGVYGPGDKEVFAFFQSLNRHIRPCIGDTSRKLQLVHVDDVCRASLAACTSAVEPGRVYHIAEPRAYSLKEMIDILQRACGRWAIPLYMPSGLFRVISAISEGVFRAVGATPMLTREKAGELLAEWEVDVTRAREELGFVAQVAFTRGAEETFAWYRRKGWLS
jgi:nucleoside-diphosphate-sugar epimerase